MPEVASTASGLGVSEEHLKAAHSSRFKAVNKKRFTQKTRLNVKFRITSRRVSVKILEVSWTYRQLLACSRTAAKCAPSHGLTTATTS